MIVLEVGQPSLEIARRFLFVSHAPTAIGAKPIAVNSGTELSRCGVAEALFEGATVYAKAGYIAGKAMRNRPSPMSTAFARWKVKPVRRAGLAKRPLKK